MQQWNPLQRASAQVQMHSKSTITSCGGFADTLLIPTLTVVITIKASTEYMMYSRKRLHERQPHIDAVRIQHVDACQHLQQTCMSPCIALQKILTSQAALSYCKRCQH